MSFKLRRGGTHPRRVLGVAGKSAGRADPAPELRAPVGRHPADRVDNRLCAAAVNKPQRPAKSNVIGDAQFTLVGGKPPAGEPMRVEESLVKAIPVCDGMPIARVQPRRQLVSRAAQVRTRPANADCAEGMFASRSPPEQSA